MSMRDIFRRFAREQVAWISFTFAIGLMARLVAALLPLVLARYAALHFGYASLRAGLLAWLPDRWLLAGSGFFGLLLALVGLWLGLRYLERFQTAMLGERLVQGLRELLFRRQLEATPEAYASRTSGKYLLRYSGDLKQVQNLFRLGLMGFFRDILVLIPVMAYLVWLIPELAWPALVGYLGLLLPLVVLNRFLYRASVRRRDRRSGLLAFVSERLPRHGLIQVLNRIEPENRKFVRRSGRLLEAGRSYYRIEALVRTLIPGLVYLVPGLALLWLQTSKGGLAGVVAPESLSVAILLLIAMGPVFRRVAAVTVHWELGKLSMRKLLLVLNQPSAMRPGLPSLEMQDGILELDGVGHQFPGREPLFSGLEWRFGPQQLSWVQGGTGSGKTVLARMLLHHLPPTSGTIFVDGQDVAGCDPKSVRKRIAGVSAVWPLLGRTVFEAISYSRKDEKRPGAARMLDRLQGGLPEQARLRLDDEIGEGGSRLSAGQQLLLQLARALLTRKPILVLDFSLHQLDEKSRVVVIRRLNRLRGKRTIIVLDTASPPQELEVDQVLDLDRNRAAATTISLRNLG